MTGSPAVFVLALAVGLDLLVGEWPEAIHPVALFGRAIRPLDRAWPHPRAASLAVAVVLPAIPTILLGGLTAFAIAVRPFAGILLAGGVLFSTLSLRMLLSVAREVITASTADVEGARQAIRALVGRDPADLSPADLRSAVIESLSENLADGFVAPLLAFVLGAQVSVGVGIGLAVWVKAVNTLDSMLGYESKPVGWASARLDDAVMWLPARLTAGLLAVAAADVGAIGRARPWVRAPPSPNSGWPMATLAVALDVELAKPGVYVLNPDGRAPTPADGHRAVRITGLGGVVAVLLAGGAVWF